MANKQEHFKQAKRLVDRLEEDGFSVVMIITEPEPPPKPKLYSLKNTPEPPARPKVWGSCRVREDRIREMAVGLFHLTAKPDGKFRTIIFNLLEMLAPQAKNPDKN